MNTAEKFLQQKLQQRSDEGSIRNLATQSYPVDFCSNDYLGFGRSVKLKQKIESSLREFPDYKNGSGGSRLLSGNTSLTEETEAFVARFHHAESALIFNSGYDANVGLLSSVPQRSDTIITDELIHASIIDGCRLSYANRYRFSHNNMEDLEIKLKKSSGHVFVVVESVYSMDGDFAPIIEISSLCERYQANLIVDEAHAIGLFGDLGKGLVSGFNLEEKVFARIVTFGKAMGVHGAAILGSNVLRHYLINFARSFIYTTAAPIHTIIAIKCAYEFLQPENQRQIQARVTFFRHLLAQEQIQSLESQSAIQGILFSSNPATRQAAIQLQNNGFDVRAILSPTVALGKERLRICLHQFNTEAEMIALVQQLKIIQING